MFDESDLILFIVGALAGAFIGYWIRDRQSLKQKLRFNKQRTSSRSPPERSLPRERSLPPD
jgi:hypothetical protein